MPWKFNPFTGNLDYFANNAHSHTADEVVYEGTETVEQILDDTLNGGVLDAVTITDDGGLNISWTGGEIFDHGNTAVVDVASGSGTCTNNAVNYLIWTTGTTLTLGLTQADRTAGEVAVGHVACQDGDIWMLHEDAIVSERETSISASLEAILPLIVTTGLLVSEDADVTNTWDVSSEVGVYYHDGHERHAEAAIDSRSVALVRHYHASSAWDSATNAEIDTTQYDNGTDLTAVSAAKYYRSIFLVGEGKIHWIYPTEEFNTVTQAIEGADPAVPPGIADTFPKSVALILRGNASAFPASGSDQWIDIRPVIGVSTGSGSITDHGNLTGLSDDDHVAYHTDARAVTWFQSNAAATVATGDLVTIQDINDSNNLKEVTAQSIADLAAATPGGSTTQVQYNNAGAFGGASTLLWSASGLDLDSDSQKIRLGATQELELYFDSSDDAYLDNTAGTLYLAGTGTDIVLNSDSLTVGDGVGDTTMTWSGGTNSGVMKWMEDEDYFQYDDISYFSEGIRLKVGVNNIADPPTDANLDAQFGTPAALGSGFMAILDDDENDTDVWICYTSSTSWFYLQGTKAV